MIIFFGFFFHISCAQRYVLILLQFFLFFAKTMFCFCFIYLFFLQERSSLTFLFCYNFFCLQTRSVYVVFFYIDFQYVFIVISVVLDWFNIELLHWIYLF